MRREYLPIDALAAWARLNSVEFHDVEVTRLQTEDGVDKGSAIVATAKKSAQKFDPEVQAEPKILMTIPPDLVLSQELVETCAKADRHLKEVLDAMGDYARVCILVVFFIAIFPTYFNLQTFLLGFTSHREHRSCLPW